MFTTFDKSELESRISKYLKQVGEYPSFTLMTSEEALLFSPNLISRNASRSDRFGWVVHENNRDFIDSCGRISKKFKLPYMTVEAASWLSSMYYADNIGSGEGWHEEEFDVVNTPEWIASRYKVSMEVASLVHMYTGRFQTSNIVNIARALHG